MNRILWFHWEPRNETSVNGVLYYAECYIIPFVTNFPSLFTLRFPGDLWSFNSASNQFVVSPEPDVNSMTIDVSRHRCLILGTDGLWNMVPPQRAVEVVQNIDRQNKMHPNSDHPMVINFFRCLSFNHTASCKFISKRRFITWGYMY